MKTTIPLGRFAGVAVGAHWSVLVTAALLVQLLAVVVLPRSVAGHSGAAYWATAAGGSVLFLLSLLLHELAHALVARHYGVEVPRVTLWLLGGVAQLDGDPPTPRAEGFIAGVGPVVSLAAGGVFALAAVVGGVAGWSALVVTMASWLAAVNVLLGAFNLLPGAPLDGGRVLRAALWKRYGDRDRAGVAATTVGQMLGTALLGLGLLQTVVTGQLTGLWLALVGWFLSGAAAAERSAITTRSRLHRVRVRDVMDPEPATAAGWWTVDAFLDRVAVRTRRQVFPVLDFEGRPVGVVSLAELARVPVEARASTRVLDAARPLVRAKVAAPGDELEELIRRSLPRAGHDLVLVVADERLAGVVDAADVARAVELGALGRSPARHTEEDTIPG
ncbi:site-2 protease family protein [Gandjariella thermophila]|uniref:Zinc metalloprotease n=1 Tax=Gandjariella thermophila TaxID=1931992 RepID=A0A4D4J3H8_9PSEU|nr:site-2 protease family protein [Gandjariella thermophila]GDY29046.1 putative zinc metalloprotease Rip3 [Gandjariella thermophila]